MHSCTYPKYDCARATVTAINLKKDTEHFRFDIHVIQTFFCSESSNMHPALVCSLLVQKVLALPFSTDKLGYLLTMY